MNKEKPFEFTEHSRLLKERSNKTISITLREEKKDNKGKSNFLYFIDMLLL